MAISYCTMQVCVYSFDKLLGVYTNLSAEMSANVAAWFAIVVVSLMNFFWLMHFVYRTAHGHRWWQFWKYLHSIIGFRLWEAVVFYLMCRLLGGDDPSWLDLLAAATIMQAQSVLMKYIVYKKLIFRAKPSAVHDEELAVHAAPPDFTEE
jgi:putative flippase GtrA